MAYKPIYSRLFLEKVLKWPEPLCDMAFEAAKHTCVDPDLNDYKRPYLTPYRQKHPKSDHQYTLYFLVVSQTEVFFTWINDPNFLHDTRNELTDPCLKEFKRLQNKKEIEVFDPKFHQIVFEVHPDKTKPFKCRSRLLGGEIHLASHLLSGNNFVGHAFSCDEQNDGIALMHATQFLNKLHEELTSGKIVFEIKFPKLGHQLEAKLLEQAKTSARWEVIPDTDFFMLRKK